MGIFFLSLQIKLPEVLSVIVKKSCAVVCDMELHTYGDILYYF